MPDHSSREVHAMSTEEKHEGVRYRRTQSVTRAEDIQAAEQKARKSQPDKPCHKPRDSLFSWNSGFNNFTGFINWAFLLLSLGGLRLLLENWIKYGFRVDPLQWIYLITGPDEQGSAHPSAVMVAYAIVPILFCLVIERALSIELVADKTGMFIHILNLLVMVLLPMVIIHFKGGFSFAGASFVTFTYSILFLKLWSYVQVNMWCRISRQQQNRSYQRRQSITYAALARSHEVEHNNSEHSSTDDVSEKEKVVQYPDNLYLKDLLYFIFAPTLCYELNFPRTERIRKRFLIKRIFEFVVGIQFILVMAQQYMIPSVKNSLIPFSNMDVTKGTERLLKLAIPNHLMWLCMFYIVFHSWLNLVGEILQFADRNFYADWWNANNIDTFWRTWNLPVHRWAVRHLYIPVVDMGYGKNTAGIMVFFLSAFFHEYLVSLPLKLYKSWAFMGMMGQIPLSHFSKYMEKHYGARWGNIIVWASLIIGQPLCVMMYYHDYIVTHYGDSLIEDYGHV